MTQQEAINYSKDKDELKIYALANGWLLTENVPKTGYNIAIQSPNNNSKIRPGDGTEKLVKELGEYVLAMMQYVEENDCDDFAGILFGWRVKLEVEPIYTDDWLLATRLETNAEGDRKETNERG